MKNSAVILIDIQNDYFPGGKAELTDPIPATKNAAKLLEHFRKNNGMVVHIQHEMVGDNPPCFEVGTFGQEIHELVKPFDTDFIVTKMNPNSFQNTELLQLLKNNKIEKLIICGMMTHMCVASTTREAFEHGFETFVVSDATATRELTLHGKTIPTEVAHEATLAGLGEVFSQVKTTKDIIEYLR